ncbi:hypothetical protein FPOA_04016 [Fusarium poae]|uniref:Uncharacterized protein n=1 Tax=Fusarium poae TaxID=36050 RepID=A0A1B8ASK6_FUSPO|nr:hypothetical protein FPOA_04016 [Fusarium poae]
MTVKGMTAIDLLVGGEQPHLSLCPALDLLLQVAARSWPFNPHSVPALNTFSRIPCVTSAKLQRAWRKVLETGWNGKAILTPSKHGPGGGKKGSKKVVLEPAFTRRVTQFYRDMNQARNQQTPARVLPWTLPWTLPRPTPAFQLYARS